MRLDQTRSPQLLSDYTGCDISEEHSTG